MNAKNFHLCEAGETEFVLYRILRCRCFMTIKFYSFLHMKIRWLPTCTVMRPLRQTNTRWGLNWNKTARDYFLYQRSLNEEWIFGRFRGFASSSKNLNNKDDGSTRGPGPTIPGAKGFTLILAILFHI